MAKKLNINPGLKAFEVLVGQWMTTGTHPMFPGITLKGKTTFEWIEGGAFLLMRNHIAHKDFPDGVATFGSDDSRKKITMLYFDERGVSRKYKCTLKNHVWTWWRNDKEFSQRFTCTIKNGGKTIQSKGKMSREGKAWEKDLQLIYKKAR